MLISSFLPLPVHIGYLMVFARFALSIGKVKMAVQAAARSYGKPRGDTPYDGLYGEAPPERGTFFRLQANLIPAPPTFKGKALGTRLASGI